MPTPDRNPRQTPTPAPTPPAATDLLRPDPATGQPDTREGGKRVRFRATIPIKAAAIDIHGETGARLTLEIADSDMADFLPIVLLRGRRLRVTVEEDAT
jgi:hypothetical protein